MCIALRAVPVQLFFPFHHICLAAVFLDQPAGAVAAFAGAPGTFDELALDVAKDQIGSPSHDGDIITAAVSAGRRHSFRHTLADAIFLTPLTLLAVPTFEFFSDVLHWRAHGHGWVTE
jgi:hypothetical protein